MNLIETAGNYALVLDTEGRSRFGMGPQVLPLPNRSNEFTAHFILNRYHVDDDGNICLTPSLPLDELYTSVEVFKAQLESLLEQVHKRFPAIPRANRGPGLFGRHHLEGTGPKS